MIRIALAAALLFSAVAATATGFVYVASESPGQNCDTPCGPWREYGWPVAWQSDAPSSYLDRTEDTHSIYNHDRLGISWGLLVWCVGAWFLIFALPLAIGATAWQRLRPYGDGRATA